jgi:adenylate cyclase
MIPARMNARWITVISGIAVGAICAALIGIPAIRALEQQYGLQGLFDLRGPVEPPDHAVLVLMNERSADSISLPRDAERFHRCEDLRVGVRPATHVSLPEMPSRWPRCVHALLLSRLAEAGARLVVFDVLFRERPPLPGADGDLHAWQDEILSRAMAMTRVVIAQKVEESGGQEQLAALSPAIADAALGAAPFPLLNEPSRRFDRFMAFKEEGLVTPTLPAVALQAYASEGYPFLRDFLIRHAGENASLLPASTTELESQGELQASAVLIRELAHKDPAIAMQLRDMAQQTRSAVHDPAAAQAIGARGALYSGDGTRLLNPYGPAGTIPSVGYDEVLTAPASENLARFVGRVVFVGYGETSRPEQVEHFSTVYSRGQVADLSGVEIAATAFSNLVDDRTIRELPSTTWLWLTFLAGFLVFVVCHGLGNRIAILVVIVLAGTYLAAASHFFSTQQLWIPIVLPLAVALPIAMLAAFGLKFWSAHQQRARLRDAFSHFVPREVVARLEHNAGDLGVTQEAIECACVATDAANYTPLAEAMTPEKLAAFLNRYYEALFGRVAERGGIVSDVVGDSMLAIWPDRAPDTRRRVLNALLELRDAAEDFNVRLAGNRLQTRFGVDWGRVALTTVGAHAHYEYRAVGDAVNTANRIQELNKRLGTRILVAEPVLSGAGGEFLTRNLGRFLLRGKTNATEIHELICLKSQAKAGDADRCARTQEAIEFLSRGDIEAAKILLGQTREAFPVDGPIAFLLTSLNSGLTRENGAWVVS